MRRIPRLLAVILISLLLMSTVSLASAATSTTETVLPDDVGPNGSWQTTISNDASIDFVPGPATAPLGNGSVEFTSESGSGRIRLYTNDWIGTPLAEIQSLTYSTYRDSNSTNPVAQYPSIVINVDYEGDGTTSANFYWEPVYSYGQASLLVDTWQTFDTMHSSQSGEPGAGGWWTDTAGVPDLPATEKYVNWSWLLDKFPSAKISGFVSFGLGSGWIGEFDGNVDALSLTVNDDTTIYDFEPFVNPPTSAWECFNNGWQASNNPTFNNMFDCVRYVRFQVVRQYLQNLCNRVGNPPLCTRLGFEPL